MLLADHLAIIPCYRSKNFFHLALLTHAWSAGCKSLSNFFRIRPFNFKIYSLHIVREPELRWSALTAGYELRKFIVAVQ